MKYRYLILPDNGDVWGTNDEAAAMKAAEDDLVLDALTAEMIDDEGDRDSIDEYEIPEALDDEDEEE